MAGLFAEESSLILTSVALALAVAISLGSFWLGHRLAVRKRDRMVASSIAAAVRLQDDLRRRISLALHAEPTQDLTFVLIRLDQLAEALETIEGLEPGVPKRLSEIQTVTGDALAKLRKMSADLAAPDGDAHQRLEEAMGRVLVSEM